MKIIKINNFKTYDDCDDCGSFVTSTTKIELPNGQSFELYGDTHLAGGPTEQHEILEEVLRKLGYEIEWDFDCE